MRFSKHGTVHGAFAQHYVKTGLFDEKYHKLLTGAFRRRMLGDYDEITRFKSDEVRQILDQAYEFLQAVKQFLASKTQ